jgi:hypothetical protein
LHRQVESGNGAGHVEQVEAEQGNDLVDDADGEVLFSAAARQLRFWLG